MTSQETATALRLRSSPQLSSMTGHIASLPWPFPTMEFLSFNLPIAGWTQMTVFLVAKSDTNPAAGQFGSENAAIFWNERPVLGQYLRQPLPDPCNLPLRHHANWERPQLPAAGNHRRRLHANHGGAQ